MRRAPEGWLGWQAAHGGSQPEGPATGVFPRFSATLLGGEADRLALALPAGATAVDTAALPAKFVLVELMCIRCPACVLQLPALEGVARRAAQDAALAGRVALLAVGVGEPAQRMAGLRRERNVGLPLLGDPRRELGGILGQSALPVLLLLGPAGPDGERPVLARLVGGGRSEEELFGLVRAAAGQTGGEPAATDAGPSTAGAAGP